MERNLCVKLDNYQESIQTVLTLLNSAIADVKFFEFMKIFILLTNF